LPLLSIEVEPTHYILNFYLIFTLLRPLAGREGVKVPVDLVSREKVIVLIWG
jgi:hypothetical protein